VLYVHGATFPSGLSIAHRFDGFSWRDALCAAGFDVWGLGFHGFGHSDRDPEMEEPPDAHAALCRTDDASAQLETAVRFICHEAGATRLSIIAHSWGSMPTCRFAGRQPTQVDRLVLFRPMVSPHSGHASSKISPHKRHRCCHAHTSAPGESAIWIAIPTAAPAIRPA